MTKIERWRKNAQLSRPEMGRLLDIPVRTIENWEAKVNTPPEYVELLVVKELIRYTKRLFEKNAQKEINRIKKDENGNRAVAAWATVSRSHNAGCDDVFVDERESFSAVIKIAEPGEEVGYVLCNIREDGTLESWFEDQDGNIYSDYDYFIYEKEDMEIIFDMIKKGDL